LSRRAVRWRCRRLLCETIPTIFCEVWSSDVFTSSASSSPVIKTGKRFNCGRSLPHTYTEHWRIRPFRCSTQSLNSLLLLWGRLLWLPFASRRSSSRTLECHPMRRLNAQSSSLAGVECNKIQRHLLCSTLWRYVRSNCSLRPRKVSRSDGEVQNTQWGPISQCVRYLAARRTLRNPAPAPAGQETELSRTGCSSAVVVTAPVPSMQHTTSEQWWLSGRSEERLSVLFCAVFCTTVVHNWYAHAYEQFLKLTVGLGFLVDLGLLFVCFLSLCLYAVYFCCVRFTFFCAKPQQSDYRKNVSET